MSKEIRDALTTSENLVSKSQFLKARAVLEELFQENAKMDIDSLVKYSILFSKVANRLGSSKDTLKKSEFCLLKAHSTLISQNKKPSIALLYQIFQSLLNLSSIYSKQNKSQVSFSYLKKLSEIPVPSQRPLKLAFLQSKVYLSLSTHYLDMLKPAVCITYANLSLLHITEVILITNKISSLEDMSLESIQNQKDKVIIYILSYLNLAVGQAEVSGQRNSAPYFFESLKYAEKLNNAHILFAVQQKYSEYFNSHAGTKSGRVSRRVASMDCPSSTFFGGNYYTEKKLKKAVKCLESEQQFISTDEFFRNKIRSELGVEEMNVEKLCRIKNSAIENLEKQAISSMRHKKHQRSHTALGDNDNFDRLIDNLHKQSEEKISKQKVKMQSKLRSKYYKNLMRSISIHKKDSIKPPQRLFFKPPVESPTFKKRGNLKKSSFYITDAFSSSKQKEIAKTEIENFLVNINNDLKEKVKLEERQIKESKLAVSAQKGLTLMKEHMECIRKTISNAILGKRRAGPAPSASFSSFLKFSSK